MKLYTEEQVREAIDRAREGIRIYRVNEFETEKEFDFSEDSIINSLIPIEFPTAIEVEIKAQDISKVVTLKQGTYIKYEAFLKGAEWIIEQIKQQSNDT